MLSRKQIYTVGILLLVLLAVWWVKIRHLTGDEPHYLMITQSVTKDHDIALENNYNNSEYKEFYDGVIAPGDRHISPNSYLPNQYSLHGVGLPVLLSPGYIVAGKIGSIAQILLLFCLSIFCYSKIIDSLKLSPRNKLFLLSTAFFSVPLIIYSHIIGYEILVATLMFYLAYRLYFQKDQPATNLNHLFYGLLISLLPWLQVKLIAIEIVLLLIIYLKNRKISIWIFPLISAIALSLFMKHYYGSYLLTAQYPTEYPNIIIFFKGLFGLFFDESFGIIIFNPLLMLLPAALFVVYKANKDFFYFSFLTFIAVIFENSLYANKIGWCPAGRMTVIVMPFVLIWLAYLLAALKNKLSSRLFFFLGCLSVTIGILLSLMPPLSYNTGQINRLFWAIKSFSHIDLSIFFPKLLAITDYLPATNGWVDVQLSSWLKLAIWILILATISTWIIKKNYIKKHDNRN